MDTARGLSYEDFLANYQGPRAEWKEGHIVPMVACNFPHQQLVGFLDRLLGFGVSVKWGGTLLVAPFQMKIGPQLPGREPDLLYLRPGQERRIQRNFVDGPADLAIEVVSPESRLRDRGEKFGEYEIGGVPEYWILDVELRRADFFLLDGEGRYQRQSTPGGVYTCAQLEGLSLPVSWCWEHPPLLACLQHLSLL